MNEIFNAAVTVASSALSILAVDVGDGVYLGKASRYMIVTTRAEPDFYGDDDPQVDRYAVDIDVYVPMSENYRTWEPTLRRQLEQASFYDVTFEGQVYDAEDGKRHLMFNGMYDIYRTGEDEEEEE